MVMALERLSSILCFLLASLTFCLGSCIPSETHQNLPTVKVHLAKQSKDCLHSIQSWHRLSQKDLLCGEHLLRSSCMKKSYILLGKDDLSGIIVSTDSKEF